MIGRRRAAGALLLLAALVVARVAAAQPTEADVDVAEAILDIDDKRYDAALEKLARALQREPDHVEALYYSGAAHLAADRPAAAIPFLERAHRISPEASVVYQLGVAYVAVGRDTDARRLLEDLFSREPGLDSLGYYVGLLRYRRAEYQGALRAFRGGRTSDPNIAQLTRLYAGLALAELGLTADAAAEMEQALRLQPASPLTAPTERLRDTLVATRASQRRLRLSASAGVYYDDNARAAPNAKVNDAIVGDLREDDRETTGELLALGVEYDWLRLDRWTATLALSLFTTYNNDLPDFNIQDVVVGASVARQTSVFAMPLALSAGYSFEYLRLDDRELVQRHSVPVTAVLVESGLHTTAVTTRVEIKEYADSRSVPSVEVQDAVNGLVGLTHVLRFAGDRHFIRFGYQFDVEDARGDNFSYVGHRGLVGGQATLPWYDLRLGYDFDVHVRDYRHRHTLLPEGREGTRAREDVDVTHTVRLELPLPRDFTVTASVTSKDVDSNIAVFDYSRTLFGLTVSWRY